MANRSPRLEATQFYFTPEVMARLRRIAEERGVTAAAIARSAIARELDEIEAMPAGLMPPRVRQQLRVGGPLRRTTQERRQKTHERQDNIER